MGKNLSALALASMLILSGCDRLGISNPFFEKEVSCGSEEAKEILVKLIRDNVEGETVKTQRTGICRHRYIAYPQHDRTFGHNHR